MNIADIIADTRTTLTSGVVGGLAGEGAQRLGSAVLDALAIKPGSSLGDDLIAFAVQGVTASITYSVAARVAPESVSNTYFTYIFFTSTSSGLVVDTMRLVNRLLDAAAGIVDLSQSNAAPPLSNLDRRASRQSSCAGC